MAHLNQHLTAVRLYGQLGKEFGFLWRLAANSTGELIAAIESQRPGFKKRLLEMNCRFRVRRDGKLIGRKNFQQGPGRSVSITPVPAGSKSGGIFQAILGAVIVIIGVIVSFVPFLGGPAVGVPLIGMGLSMFISGLAQLMAPQPGKQKEKQNTNSYVFDGPTNVNQQGGPVPCLYGRLPIGSVCVSAGIAAREYWGTAPVISGGYHSGSGAGGTGFPVHWVKP